MGDRRVFTPDRIEHNSRQPWPEDVPIPPVVRSWVTLGKAHGFEVRATYSRAGNNDLLRHFIRVRMFRMTSGGKRIFISIGYRSDVGSDKWTTDGNLIMVPSSRYVIFPYASSANAKEFILAQGECDDQWYADIANKHHDREARAKQAAKARPKASSRKGVTS